MSDDLKECDFGYMVIYEAEGFLEKRCSPADIAEFHAHEKICHYCQHVRANMGERVFHGNDEPEAQNGERLTA